MEEVKNFIKECGAYFLATVDGDEPKVRPFGTIEIFEGKLYIQTGKTKNVSKQIQKNGKVQLCAMNKAGNKWLRLSGTLVRDDRREPKVLCSKPIPNSSACIPRTTKTPKSSTSRMQPPRSAVSLNLRVP